MPKEATSAWPPEAFPDEVAVFQRQGVRLHDYRGISSEEPLFKALRTGVSGWFSCTTLQIPRSAAIPTSCRRPLLRYG